MPRYKRQITAINNSELYEELFENRGVGFIKQRRTFIFTGLDLVSPGSSEYIWKSGDSLHKLSHLFYGTLQYWWIIALFNHKPTDAHYKIGDTILIPTNPISIAQKIGG